MKFSIITACFNSQEVLGKAIESLASQRHSDYEWVVVDGGSSDATMELVRSSGIARIQSVSEKDSGIYDAMNKGVGRAKGEILYFLNSDDAFYDSNVLADVAAIYKSDSALQVVFGNVVYVVDGVPRTTRTFKHVTPRSLLVGDLCHQAVFVRREVFERIGEFNETFRINADYDWLIRTLRAGKSYRWIDRNIAFFNVGGAHTRDPGILASERKRVHLQYISSGALACRLLVNRLKQRALVSFGGNRVGHRPVETRASERRVILLSHGFQPEYEAGFANGLARNGVSVTLVASDETLVDRLHPGIQTVNLRGSQDPSRPRGAKAWNLFRYCISYLWYVLFNRRESVHVIGFFSTNSIVFSMVEAWLTRLVGSPYILTVHNLLPHDRHTRLNRWACRCIYRAPRLLMVHTPRAASELASFFNIPRSRIRVVEHGFDRALMPDPRLRMDWRTEVGVPQAARILLFFGNVVRYKGLDVLIEAFQQVGHDPSAHLVIAGRCRDSSLRREIEQLISSNPCRARIHWFEGYMAADRVPALVHAADVLVLPYRHIDQSGVVFMGLSAGLPIVASDVGSFKDYVIPGASEIVPPGDAVALAAALARMLNCVDSLDRGELIRSAQRFSWSQTVTPLISEYGTRHPRLKVASGSAA